MNPDGIAGTWEGRTARAWSAAWEVPGLVLLESTPSTNDVARHLAAEGHAAGTTVIADFQTHGRGRRGRSWQAGPGQSLLLSVILRAESTPVDPSTAPLRVGLALCRAIEAETGARCGIKWPNDVLAADGRKLAGVLCEGAAGKGDTWLVAGVGVNVAQRPEDFEPEIRDSATSVSLLGGSISRARLAAAVLDQLRPFRIQPPPLDAQLLEELAPRDVLRDREITVDGAPAGIADGISADGGLRVRRDGRMTVVRAGTVRLAGQAATHGVPQHPTRPSNSRPRSEASS